jgi:outer membrane protein assembly factor BamB
MSTPTTYASGTVTIGGVEHRAHQDGNGAVLYAHRTSTGTRVRRAAAATAATFKADADHNQGAPTT